MDWSWVLQRRRRQRRKVLAGFARATGDVTLTASIWDLAIHPELQGLGLGRRLLAKISNQVGCPVALSLPMYECPNRPRSLTALLQIRNRFQITDIGLITPPAQIGFFQHCGFAPDREKSVAMCLLRQHAPEPTNVANFQNSEGLHKCLEAKLEKCR